MVGRPASESLVSCVVRQVAPRGVWAGTGLGATRTVCRHQHRASCLAVVVSFRLAFFFEASSTVAPDVVGGPWRSPFPTRVMSQVFRPVAHRFVTRSVASRASGIERVPVAINYVRAAARRRL